MTNHQENRGDNDKASVAKFYLPSIDPTTGLRLRHGNGCYAFDNCFAYPYPENKCKYHCSSYPRRKTNGIIC